MARRRTRRRKGGKCKYEKVDGKWKNVCTKTKTNVKIEKTSLSDSKKGYTNDIINDNSSHRLIIIQKHI